MSVTLSLPVLLFLVWGVIATVIFVTGVFFREGFWGYAALAWIYLGVFGWLAYAVVALLIR
jgi:hypothetical protein